MFEAVRISPSILSADYLSLGAEVEAVTQAGADWIHVDVMDGHFVPNITIGVPLVSSLKSRTALPIDVHLMVSNPLEQIPWFLDAGADYLTFHWEAFEEEVRIEQAQKAAHIIRQAECKAGLALKPSTPIDEIVATLHEWDMVLVMSVYPGFSGQSYIPETASRIERLADLCRQEGCSPLIQVDGGIGVETAPLVAGVGADVLVAGNAVFKANDYARAVSGIRQAAEDVQPAQNMR